MHDFFPKEPPVIKTPQELGLPVMKFDRVPPPPSGPNGGPSSPFNPLDTNQSKQQK